MLDTVGHGHHNSSFNHLPALTETADNQEMSDSSKKRHHSNNSLHHDQKNNDSDGRKGSNHNLDGNINCWDQSTSDHNSTNNGMV